MFQADLLGDDAGEVPGVNDAEDDAEDEQQQQQQQANKAAAGRSGKQQQQQAARQATMAKKAASSQKNLTFVAHDKAVLQQLPAFIREQVPFLATARGAIDVQLLTLLKLFSTAGVGFATMTKAMQELQHTQYYQRALIYYSMAAAIAEKAKPADPRQRTLYDVRGEQQQQQQQQQQQPPPFVSKEDAGLYNMSPPWLIDVFLASTEEARK